MSSLPADAESQFLLCTFSMAAKIIAADGKIEPEERNRLSEYMRSELSLSEKEEKLAWKIFDEALGNELELRDYAHAFKRYFPDRVQLTDRVVVTLLGLASSDGYVHPKEEEEIRTAALLLDIPAPTYERLKSENLKNEERFH